MKDLTVYGTPTKFCDRPQRMAPYKLFKIISTQGASLMGHGNRINLHWTLFTRRQFIIWIKVRLKFLIWAASRKYKWPLTDPKTALECCDGFWAGKYCCFVYLSFAGATSFYRTALALTRALFFARARLVVSLPLFTRYAGVRPSAQAPGEVKSCTVTICRRARVSDVLFVVLLAHSCSDSGCFN